MASFSVHRVGVGQEAADGKSLRLFVHTGTRRQPLVTPADNDGFPELVSWYAKGDRHRGKDGVDITFRFSGPARGRGFAFNLGQEGIDGPMTVIPLA